jgi:hypothetical protein
VESIQYEVVSSADAGMPIPLLDCEQSDRQP